ncbi:hypothetical protein GGR42_002596 [Saonia flava]|uniref:DUF4249 domain-containing protein n=1 Tax=Saonia flava TaxID=523696 RepID=A0A846R2E0_9FLAO|nr:DUF4249 family protein [Saonia flava]NJB72105.1 hypothetical protein [Saonia flava]
MKQYIRISILFLTIALASCTDVIDVDVQNAPARLVIEASLDWEKGTVGNNQTIKLSTSTPYFDTTTNSIVTGASVKVTHDADGAEFIFADQNNGNYTNDTFVPILDDSYTLEVIYNGDIYSATEKLMSVTDITDIVQSKDKGFDEEAIEISTIFTDPEEEENYYFFKFQRQGDLLPYLEVGDDEFVNGNEIDWWYEIEEDEYENIEPLAPGDVVAINFYGISDAYYNYMSILIEQTESDGPFSSTPVALKGNCINLTTPDNYANGYFRLSQVIRTSYTVQ